MTSRSTHDNEAVTRLLRALAQADANLETAPRVKAAVMAGWDAAHAPRRQSRTRAVVRGAVAVAAGITAIGALTLHYSPGTVLPRLPAAPDHAAWSLGGVAPVAIPEPAAVQAASRAPQPAQEVLMLLGDPLTEGEPVRVVRMRVASSTLAALGIQSVGPQRPESIDLDVLVTEDGVARALRVGL